MPEHLSEQDIQRYHSRGLSPSERLRLCDHIAQCEGCRQRTRAGNPRPFNVSAFRAELRVPAEETSPDETRRAAPAWQAQLAKPRVLVPAFGAALLLVIALIAQNASLRREYAALARRADLVSGRGGQSAIAIREDRPRSGGLAATQVPSGSLPAPIASAPLTGTVADSKPAASKPIEERRGATQKSVIRVAGVLPANTKNHSKPGRSQHRASTLQMEPTNTIWLAAARLLKTINQQPAVVRASDGRAAGLARVKPGPDILPNDLPENGMTKVVLSPEERRLFASAEKPDTRSGENVHSDEQPTTVKIITPTGPMIIVPPDELRWKAVEGAAVYKVYLSEVFRLDTGLVGNKALDGFKEEQSVTDTTFPIRHPLAPGKVYQLDVTAYANEQASKPLAHASLRFLVLDKRRAKMLESMAESQFAYGQLLEQTYQWERAANLYRAIDPAAAKTFDKAQSRLTDLEQRQQIQP